jgi:hypothetical protein
MARTISRRKKCFTLTIAAVLTLAGASAAFAYWTSEGSGSGEATTGESAAFVITSDTAVGTIAPGSPGQTVDFTVTNPGPGTLTLTGVTVSMASATGVAWVPTGDCDIADYTATITDNPTDPNPVSLLASEDATGTATVTLTSTAVNQDDCQGQEVPLYFVAS